MPPGRSPTVNRLSNCIPGLFSIISSTCAVISASGTATSHPLPYSDRRPGSDCQLVVRKPASGQVWTCPLGGTGALAQAPPGRAASVGRRCEGQVERARKGLPGLALLPAEALGAERSAGPALRSYRGFESQGKPLWLLAATALRPVQSVRVAGSPRPSTLIRSGKIQRGQS